jgi:hypothetical protein
MAVEKLKKTEHNGAKHGQGAWTTKFEAKTASRKRRRESWKMERGRLLAELSPKQG